MSDQNYYQNIISQASKRSVESTIGVLGVTHKGLRKHLTEELGGKLGLGMLADPVFEAIFPWEKSEKLMSALAGNMLLPSLVKAMDDAGDHKFGRNWFPFKHQLKSWSTLLTPPYKSLVVTSGTGSGKTECFMVPILNDLAEEYERTNKPLVGVRALFLYPLNALINSQRERLRAWTEAYDDGLRFCLYNGNTVENRHRDQGKYPNEILTRKIMRETPAPMLVTNSTMLEYMLVRQIDDPIIQKSEGKLRWIVLDEAHSYIGSQAAELSLLLRRVMHTFGVDAKNVRFVATSATIGDDKADQQLQEYLANLAGISIDNVVVVGGKRSIPLLPESSLNDKGFNDIVNIDRDSLFSQERYHELISNKTSIELRKKITDKNIPSTLSSLTKSILFDISKQNEMLKWIDLCSSTIKPGPNLKQPENESEPFLPLRGHLFHEVLSGLWCCVDRNCQEKKGTHLSEGWPFGMVYSQRSNHCECGAPVFELLFCGECNSPHLMAIDHSGDLIQRDQESVDEFSLSYENTEDDESEDRVIESSDTLIIAPHSNSKLTYTLSIDNKRHTVPPGMDTFDLNIINNEDLACSNCETAGYKAPFYRRCLLGTPFYISNAIPTILDACQDAKKANELPNRGKRLITFTDSRQGTARISTKIQQDSEKDSVRGLIYGITSQNIPNIDKEDLKEKQQKLKKYQSKVIKYKDIDEDMANDLDELASKLSEELESYGKIKSIKWIDAVAKLSGSGSLDISRWIFNYYKELNPILFSQDGDARVLTEMLLMREFARRPKRLNSMETMGLVSVQYPTLNAIKKAPDEWKRLNLDLTDWINFLKLILDFFVRGNSIIDIPIEWINWIGIKIYPKTVINPESDEKSSSRVVRWPQVLKGNKNRIVRILSIACDLNVDDPLDKDRINAVLKEAWKALTKRYQIIDENTQQIEVHQILKNVSGSVHYHLAREEMAFMACTQVWICPFTHRLLDSTFKDISPYLPVKISLNEVLCQKVSLPVCQLDISQFKSDLERKLAVRKWITEQEEISSLRSENLWTNMSDRVLEGSKFYRAAEHSAQQPASKLEKYESQFKAGKLNVLSCSTTMEMGVDIGGISVVAMNNVPPHPANYLQRSGRAGRRGETQALTFTICKDNPHERGVFTNPLWPFTTAIDAPYITLNSERIIQRHINSLLLAYFLKTVLTVKETAITSLSCQWFFVNDEENQAPIDKMLRWFESFKVEQIPDKLNQGIKQIIKGGILSVATNEQIINNSIIALENAKDKWLPGYLKLKVEYKKVEKMSEKDPYRRKVEYDLKCMGDQYLLSELASHAFLPGYGFPTGIATFDHYSVSDFLQKKYVNKSGRIDNQTRMRERPGRDMSVAIREYAPGADVVLDGLVYKSAGILLNKFSPNEDYSEPQKISVEWRCHSCGFIGNESGITFDHHCSECGSELDEENIKEYIEPIGFAVDFYSNPTNDVSSQMYVPVQEPWVTSNTAFIPLFEPKLGTFRNSSQGHIFNHSSGEFGNGYAVCLRCGKTESMTNDNDYPDNLKPQSEHKKLQGKTGPESLAFCEGSDEAYAIKPNVHLGSTTQTDVFEIYLKYPTENIYIKHLKNDPLPWTLAVVLRQSLADIHGINAEEMGYTIKPTTLPDCNYPIAGIVLYDKNGGGSGFSSAAPLHIQDMFKRALNHLQCSDNCDSACQSCLMGYDTRFHNDVLNRHVAIDYINSILPYLAMPENAMIFGDSSRYCLESISAEIIASANKGFNKLKIISDGNYSDWNITDSSLKEVCLTWRNVFNSIDLVLPNEDLSDLDEVHKEDLKALTKFGVNLTVNKNTQKLLHRKGNVLAQISSNEQVISIGANSLVANIPNNQWWDIADYYLVKSESIDNIPTLPLDLSLLNTLIVQGDIEVELTTECDGLLNDFSQKLWSKLLDESEQLKLSINNKSKLLKINYSDSYICSPLTLMLFAEVVDGIKNLLGGNWNTPTLILNTAQKKLNNYYSPKGLYADWDSDQIRSDVIREYFEQMDEILEVNIKPMKALPHGRALTLYWDDNSITSIRFDHGFGCWSINGRPAWINLKAKPKVQVEEMYNILRNLKIKFNKQFPTQIFIKRRQ